MNTVSAVAPDQDRPWSPGARLGGWAALGLAALALLETAQAIIAPLRAPSAADWKAAGDQVRADFRPGDLIVAAPAWADPVVRMQLGDLLPIAAAARMDDARFGRVWVVSQRGGRAEEEAGRVQTVQRRFGALTVRRFERAPAPITYDFLERWQDAYVTLWDPAAPARTPCPWVQDAFTCAQAGETVRRKLVEVDQRIRRAILAPAVAGAVVSVAFPAAILGRDLVVAVGLHDTWARKSPGTVYFQVRIAGQPARATVVDNRSGWQILRIDTSARDGQATAVDFQVSAPQAALRYLAFAAEARR